MRRVLILATLAASLAPGLVCAQSYVASSATYTEVPVAVPAATWTVVAPFTPLVSPRRQGLTIADQAGKGCSWSAAASPITGEGVPFSTTAAGGSWRFDPPIPNNAIKVYCTNAATITVVGS